MHRSVSIINFRDHHTRLSFSVWPDTSISTNHPDITNTATVTHQFLLGHTNMGLKSPFLSQVSSESTQRRPTGDDTALLNNNQKVSLHSFYGDNNWSPHTIWYGCNNTYLHARPLDEKPPSMHLSLLMLQCMEDTIIIFRNLHCVFTFQKSNVHAPRT